MSPVLSTTDVAVWYVCGNALLGNASHSSVILLSLKNFAYIFMCVLLRVHCSLARPDFLVMVNLFS